MFTQSLQHTLNEIDEWFGNEWFTIRHLLDTTINRHNVFRLKELGIIEYDMNAIQWRLNPVQGCEVPPVETAPKFRYGQIVKFIPPYLDGADAFSYGVLIENDNAILTESSSALVRVHASDDLFTQQRVSSMGVYYSYVKYENLIDIEGSEWNRCEHCHMPYPITELSDTVVSLCDSCADIEDFYLIREMNRLHEDGQAIEDYQTINSGRAYDKYMLDMEYWKLKIYKAEKARLAAYRQRIAHEDCLDAAKERREVKS